jgi:hypothetical protein
MLCHVIYATMGSTRLARLRIEVTAMVWYEIHF